jgi:hypothetical protein
MFIAPDPLLLRMNRFEIYSILVLGICILQRIFVPLEEGHDHLLHACRNLVESTVCDQVVVSFTCPRSDRSPLRRCHIEDVFEADACEAA